MKIPIQCPGCNRRFVVEDCYAGRLARCTKCQSKIPIPCYDAADTKEKPPVESAPELKADNFWPEAPDKAPPAVQATLASSMYPADQIPPAETTAAEDIAETGSLFRKDLIHFIIPFRSKAEASTFAAILLLVAFWPFIKQFNIFCCLMFIIRAAILGCLCTFFFNIVRETAQGSDELPYPDSIRGALENIWSEGIVPLTNFIASFIYIALPAMIINIVIQFVKEGKFNLDAHPSLVANIIFIGGSFFWPMVLLILAFDKITLLLRPDLIIKSIIDVILPYLLCWLCLLAGFAIMYVIGKNLPGLYREVFVWDPKIIVMFILIAINLSVFIYAMRVIGLLYRHYHHLFFWQLDKPDKHPLEE